jgi:hypothetical protein
MEDDKSTTDSELDTNLDDQDVELEDIEVSEEDITSTDDDTDTSEESLEDEPKQEVESEQQESEEEAEAEPEEDEQAKPSEDEQRAFNKQMAEKRIQEKQAREASIRDQQQTYVSEAEDDRDLALRQLQVDAYNNKVESNTNKLTIGYEKALKDFPILADNSPEIKAEIDAAIDAFQAMYVKVDSYGNPKEVTGDLYKYLQTKADSIQRLTQIGVRQQVNNKAKEKSKTFTPPSRTPKEPKIDLDLKAFEEEASRW